MALIETLQDRFDDGSIDGALWATYENAGATVTETGGRIVFTPPASTVGAEASIYTITTYNLTASSIYIKLFETAGPSIDNYILLTKDASNKVGFIWDSGDLTTYTKIAGTDSYREFVSVSAGESFWLRIRESSGTVYWDYSTNNQSTWTNLDSILVSSLFAITLLEATIGVYEWGSSATPGTSKFDSLNFFHLVSSVSDSTSISESVTVSTSTLTITTEVYDTITVTETAVVSTGGDISIFIDDDILIEEGLRVFPFVFDAVGISEGTSLLAYSFVDTSESVSISESVTASVSLVFSSISVSDSRSITESVSASRRTPDPDTRAYQHGVDIVETSGGTTRVFWSSIADPLSEDTWTHDIYQATIDSNGVVSTAAVLISETEAQEPVSAAINTAGNIFLTMEDGFNVVNTIGQRYGVYDSNLGAVDAYPNMILDGGHSGHVAAAGTRFIVFYSEGWIDGGGEDNLGSGDGVYASVHSSNGTLERSVTVHGPGNRDWWPIIASSSTRCLLVWQRFVSGQDYAKLRKAILDPATGTITAEAEILANVDFYRYTVTYLPDIDRFVVVGNLVTGGATAFLIDTSGSVIATAVGLPSIVREVKPAVGYDGTVLYPMYPTGAFSISVTASSITEGSTYTDDYSWRGIGTTGKFLSTTQAMFFSLSENGVRTVFFDVGTEPLTVSVSESIALSENLSSDGPLAVSVSENISIGEGIVIFNLSSYGTAVSEGVSIQESVTVSADGGTYSVDASDSISISEGVTVLVILNASSSDGLSVSDSPGVNVLSDREIGVSELVSIAENVTLLVEEGFGYNIDTPRALRYAGKSSKINMTIGGSL